jgi:NADP-dependent 3-hydroxy acid dehydrogenase YdfG
MNQVENRLKDKVVVITGASSGIGEAIAKRLASHGAKVVLGARRQDRLEELAGSIIRSGGKAAYVVTDVSKRADLIGLVRVAKEHYGRLDVMINNAGVSQLSLVEELDVEGWEEMIDVNLKGTLYGIAAAMPVFKEQNSGHIINIISTSGIKIVPMQAVYAGTKNAVRTISEALRQESNGWLRVTGVSPGFVQTELAGGIKNEEMKETIQRNMKTLAISPEAVAHGVAFAIAQPANVEIGDLVIRPAAQN